MANSMDVLLPKVLAEALLILRENALALRLVDMRYSPEVASYGETVTIPISGAVPESAIQDVAPSLTPSSVTHDISVTHTEVKLQNWKRVKISLNDREYTNFISSGAMPLTFAEILKTFANYIDKQILAELYKNSYMNVGTIGQVPFASGLSEVQTMYRESVKKLWTPDNKYLLLDPEASANLIGNANLLEFDKSNSTGALRDAQIGRLMSFDTMITQNLGNTHTVVASGYLVNQTNHAAGDKAVIVDTGTGAINPGDMFTVAGHSQTYVVTGYATNTVSFYPEAKVAFANNAAITFTASHVVSGIAFQRRAVAMVARPMTNVPELGSNIYSMTDPVTGLPLRVEARRESKLMTLEFDLCWGLKCLYPDMIQRVIR